MKLSVYKFDPTTDDAPHYIEGEVPFHDKMTALEALVWFHENVYPVNFDYSCHGRLCGRCAMMLDGVPTLMCSEPLTDADHVIEPLAGYPVIRDLTVDKSLLFNRISSVSERVRIEPFTQETIVPKDYDDSTTSTLYALEFCNRCGACNSACPALAAHPDEYIGPAGMVAIAYRELDQLDQGDRIMQAVSNGLYLCIQCGMCDQVCAQQDIDHLGIWALLRDRAAERGLVPSYAQ